MSSIALKNTLEHVVRTTDQIGRLQKDPVRVVRRYAHAGDQELVALLAACLAFGNVTVVLRKLDDALARLGTSPTQIAEHRRSMHRQLEGWSHRLYRGAEVAALLYGARCLQKEYGSLGQALAVCVASTTTWRDALSRWVQLLRHRAGISSCTASQAERHLLPDPAGDGACKRLHLFLRWMIRPDDGVDVGLWTHLFPTDVLCMPVDTHILRLSRNLGFTKRSTATWPTVVDITQRLARLDPRDPIRYDFALCHLGMARNCPSRADTRQCAGCGIQGHCIHWKHTPTR